MFRGVKYLQLPNMKMSQVPFAAAFEAAVEGESTCVAGLVQKRVWLLSTCSRYRPWIGFRTVCSDDHADARQELEAAEPACLSPTLW